MKLFLSQDLKRKGLDTLMVVMHGWLDSNDGIINRWKFNKWCLNFVYFSYDKQ